MALTCAYFQTIVKISYKFQRESRQLMKNNEITKDIFGSFEPVEEVKYACS